jgi:ribonuclease HI
MWAPGWEARGWKRTGGPIGNLELWKELMAAAEKHDVQWSWLRGHAGHPKNEYVDRLAVAAAREQKATDGAVESGFLEWMVAKQAKDKYRAYDPDWEFDHLAKQIAAGEKFPVELSSRAML